MSDPQKFAATQVVPEKLIKGAWMSPEEVFWYNASIAFHKMIQASGGKIDWGKIRIETERWQETKIIIRVEAESD